MIFVTAVAVLVTLAAIFVLFSRWALDTVGIFCISFSLFYGFRLVAVATGADSLYPDYLFFEDTRTLEAVNLFLLVFLVCVGVGLAAGRATRIETPWLFPAVRTRPTVRRYWIASVALTVVATLITGYLLARYHGFSGMVRASKFDKELAGTFFLRVFPTMGSAVAAAGFLDLRQRALRARNLALLWRARLLLGMAGLNAFYVFAWGARSQLACVAFIVFAGLGVFPRPRHSRAVAGRPGFAIRLVIVAAAVITLVVGLRVGRDIIISGTTTETIAGESMVRQVSVASNSVTYDAFVLAVRDWPARYEYRYGRDFVVGALGVVPRTVWSGKPEHIIPGAWFRQVYEPSKRNGWPMGSVGEWYLNFGFLGIVAGGLLSGLALAFAQRMFRTSRRNPFAFSVTAVVGFLVLDLGVGSQFTLRWTSVVLPLIVLTHLLEADKRPVSAGGHDVDLTAETSGTKGNR